MPGRLPAPSRALWFFILLMLAHINLGAPIQRALGLWGIAVALPLVFVLLPVVFARMTEQRSLTEVFRLRTVPASDILKSVLLGFTAWLTAHTLGLVSLYVVERLGGKMPELYTVLMRAPLWAALLVGAIVPALSEEVAFRGYVLWGMGPTGTGTAVVVTGLLFGMMHLSLVRMLPLSALGILFAAAVQRTGSILPGMIMHFVTNAISLSLAFYARANLPELTETAEIHPQGVLVWAGIGVVAGICSWGLLTTLGRRTEEKPQGERMPLWAEVLPLAPALWYFSVFAYYEYLRVFRGVTP